MYSLLDKALTPENLRKAWEAVAANDALPGVDSLSIRHWRRNWEERLVNLAGAVRSHTYQPHKLRLRRIPKRNWREWRLLRIPTVTDRVLQRAVLQALYPVFEPHFLRCSFGYRPQHSLKQAVERILVLRENAMTFRTVPCCRSSPPGWNLPAPTRTRRLASHSVRRSRPYGPT